MLTLLSQRRMRNWIAGAVLVCAVCSSPSRGGIILLEAVPGSAEATLRVSGGVPGGLGPYDATAVVPDAMAIGASGTVSDSQVEMDPGCPGGPDSSSASVSYLSNGEAGTGAFEFHVDALIQALAICGFSGASASADLDIGLLISGDAGEPAGLPVLLVADVSGGADVGFVGPGEPSHLYSIAAGDPVAEPFLEDRLLLFGDETGPFFPWGWDGAPTSGAVITAVGQTLPIRFHYEAVLSTDSSDGLDGSTTVRLTTQSIPNNCIGSFADPDCNGNGVRDECEFSLVTTADCNTNLVPDECEITSDPDCNANGVLDACDIAGTTSSDCNNNFIPDECDLAAGVGEDCNGNGRLDDCDVLNPANDVNADGIPDECQCSCGDLTGDRAVQLIDFAVFALCFGRVEPGQINCLADQFRCSDMNWDGLVNLVDFSTLAIYFGQSDVVAVTPNCMS